MKKYVWLSFMMMSLLLFTPDFAGKQIQAMNLPEASNQFKYDQISLDLSSMELLTEIPSETGLQTSSSINNAVTADFPRWKNTIFSYLSTNPDQTLTAVEIGVNPISIKKYNSAEQLISEKNIPFELPFVGAFYSGEKYNYIAFGQANYEENNDKEVFRIVRYDKDFNRIDSVSIKGGESFTIEPFAYAAGRMNEKGSELVLHTSRLRYTTADGLNHQSQLTIIVDTDTMKVTNDLGQFQRNHVSHSFDQYVQYDGDERVLLDHGDAYPRSIVLNQQSGEYYKTVDLFVIPGAIGANCTGVSIGGFEVSNENYLVAMNSIDHSQVSEYTSYEMVGLGLDQRDVLLCTVPKNSINNAAVKITTLGKYVGSDRIASIPKLVRISEQQMMVLWQEFNLNGEIQDLKYVYLDGAGQVSSEIQTVSGMKLSECQPVVFGNQLLWYTNENGNRTFYAIPIVDFQKVEQLINQISSLPPVVDLTIDDKNDIDQICNNYESLTQMEKERIGADLLIRLNAAEVRIAELVRNTQTSIYSTHIQNIGWQSWKEAGEVSGTVGEAKRLEAIRISVKNLDENLDVVYQTHIQNIGWQEEKTNGEISGTSGQSLRLEAIRIRLTGINENNYDIYYQVHAQNYGWLDWAKNGESAGTAGFGYRLEGIRIKVLPKGSAAPGSTNRPFIEK